MSQDIDQRADSFRSGELATDGFEDWSDDILHEFKRNLSLIHI